MVKVAATVNRYALQSLFGLPAGTGLQIKNQG
jgi:hypothetical protein